MPGIPFFVFYRHSAVLLLVLRQYPSISIPRRQLAKDNPKKRVRPSFSRLAGLRLESEAHSTRSKKYSKIAKTNIARSHHSDQVQRFHRTRTCMHVYTVGAYRSIFLGGGCTHICYIVFHVVLSHLRTTGRQVCVSLCGIGGTQNSC